MSNEVIFHLVKVVIAAGMVLCAILVWRKTRDTTWVLMVFAAIFWYAQILLDLLEALSLVSAFPLAIRIIAHSLPLIMFSSALLSLKPDRDIF